MSSSALFVMLQTVFEEILSYIVIYQSVNMMWQYVNMMTYLRCKSKGCYLCPDLTDIVQSVPINPSV